MEEKQGFNKRLKLDKFLKTQLIVTIVCLIMGTLLHFTYDWSGKNMIVASFSAVNESVWEHLKLAFFPMLIMSVIEYFILRDIANNFIESKAIGIFMAISFIVVTFFTYTGILGTSIIFIDILIFIVSIILGECVSYRLMKRKNESTISTKILSSLIILTLFICFIVCTYCPPEVNLFRDPTTGLYGIDS